MSQRRPAGQRPARGGGGAGSGSNAGARGALLLGVAVILGIVLLQQFDTDVSTVGAGSGSATSVPAKDTTSTTRRVGLTTVPVVTPTTVKARVRAEVKVQVANGAGVRGLAATTTEALKGQGYTGVLTPTDVTSGTVDKTSIQYADGFEAEAREVATALSQPPTVVSRLGTPAITLTALNDEAKVVVILGVDVTAPTTTAAGATTSTTRRP